MAYKIKTTSLELNHKSSKIFPTSQTLIIIYDLYIGVNNYVQLKYTPTT